VKKQRHTAALLSVLLLSALAGALLINLAAAAVNPFGRVIPPPAVTIQLPENKIYTENSVSVAFTIEGSEKFAEVMRAPDYYSYILDGESASFWPSQVSSSGSSTYLCKATLSGLPEGIHQLSVVVSLTYVWDNPIIRNYYATLSSGSDTAVFTVNAAAPRVSVLSPQQSKTYNTVTLPLDFTVSEPANWFRYSLDGEEPVTVTGNTTIFGLSDGTHSIIVNAEDTAGSTGASMPVTFKVETQKADKPTETQKAPLPILWTATAAIASATIITFGLLAYLALRKKRRG
jgi:hypothetical protein